MTVVAAIKLSGNPERSIVTYALLDGGSNTTFCTKKLMDQLGLKGNATRFLLTTLGKENKETKSSVVGLEIYDLNENVFLELPTVFTMPTMPISVDDIPKQADIERWPHLQGIDAEVGLLIGNDNIKVLEPKRYVKSEMEVLMQLERCLDGQLTAHLVEDRVTALLRTSSRPMSNITSNSRVCNREFNDTIDESERGLSQDDQKAISIMKDTVQLKDGHYEIDLPWRTKTPPCQPDNKSLVKHRLGILKKRFIKDPELLKKYSHFMEELLGKSYAERERESHRKNGIDQTDTFGTSPHHTVFHPMKPGKIRIVFDCSAKYREISLNSELLQGPI